MNSRQMLPSTTETDSGFTVKAITHPHPRAGTKVRCTPQPAKVQEAGGGARVKGGIHQRVGVSFSCGVFETLRAWTRHGGQGSFWVGAIRIYEGL